MLFVRNLALAFLIPVADYGIASTFAIAMAVVEMSTQFGLQVLIVQDKRGDDPRFQAALQGFQLLRGILAGILLFLLAGLLADFMKIPEVAWAYQLMALAPVLRSMQHFDIHRLNREMRFGPLILTSVLPAFASLLSLWPLALWFSDYRVMLYALLLQSLLEVVISHIMAERPYRLVLDRAVIVKSMRFGWPLLTNGILLFLVFQGDRVIVGRELGIEILAVFSMGVTLTLTPTLVMIKSIQNFFLTPLSRNWEKRQSEPAPFQSSAEAAIQGNLLSGAALIVGTLLLGPWFVRFALPAEYAALGWMLIWMAIQQGLRVIKNGPNLVSLSCGFTVNELLANAIRVASLGVIWWSASNGRGLPEIFAIAIAAEILAGVLSVFLMQAKVGISLKQLWPGILASLGVVALASLSASSPYLGLSELWSLSSAALCLACFGLLVALSGSFWKHFRKSAS